MFTFKSYQKILGDLVTKTISETPITDVRPGSAILTLLEAVANEDAQLYVAMLELIQTYNLDTTTGADLDERAYEYGLSRLASTASSGYVTFSDSAVTKRLSYIYSPSASPLAGSITIDVEYTSDIEFFSSSGSIIVGRNTNHVETITYSSITDHGDYVTFHLTSGLLYDHGAEETIIFAQGGDRTIPLSTEVYVPATDISAKISFRTRESATILDGEESITDVLVVCETVGSIGNVPIGAISSITTPPITTIEVTNSTAYINGQDEENDQELRDRIRNNIQSLSRGTKTAVLTGIARIFSSEDNKTVLSASYVESTDNNQPSSIYIDDGTGFEPSVGTVGIEDVIAEAAGTERFLNLDNYPIAKASLVTSSSEPYTLTSGQTLEVWVGLEHETLILSDTAFKNIAAATAEELAAHLNDISVLIEARTFNTGNKVIISPISNINDSIKITGGTANTYLGFKEDIYINSLYLYKNDILLSKDGEQAFVESAVPTYGVFALTSGDTLTFKIDNKTANTNTVTFTSTDPIILANGGIGALTPTGVVAVINTQAIGCIAETTSLGSVRITSLLPVEDGLSYIQITGGSANAQLGFSTSLVSGKANDYSFNRMNGQIELMTPLAINDSIAAGSRNTRAYFKCSSSELYAIDSSDTLVIVVDGGVPITHAFTTLGTGLFLAQDIATHINSDSSFLGITAFVKTIAGDNYLAIRTNTQGSTGSLRINSSPAGLDFEVAVTKTNQDSMMSYVNSDTSPYTIGRDQNLVIILDDDPVNRTYNLTLQSAGIISAVTDASDFNASVLSASYGTNDFFKDAVLQFDHTTATAQLRDELKTISSYVAATGQITFATDFITAPSVGDTFKIYPRTAKNLVDLLNNTAFTSLSVFAEIELSSGDTKAQITSKTNGSDGAVQITGGSANSFSIPFVTDGTSNGICTVNSISGLSQNLPVIISGTTLSNITGICVKSITGSSAPYTISVRRISAPDISAYTTAQTATIVSPAILFNSNGTSSGTFTVTTITGLAEGQAITIDDLNSAALDCYIRYISPSAIALNLSAYTTAQNATIVTPAVPFTTNGTAGGTFDVASTTGLYEGQIIEIVDNDTSSVYGYISDITGTQITVVQIMITVETAPDLSTYSTTLNSYIHDYNGTGFDAVLHEGIDGYKYFTGLLREVQRTIDGYDSLPDQYPGIKAAGVQLETKAPLIKLVELDLDVTPSAGIALSSLSNDIKSAVAAYVNSRGVGQDIILSEIIAVVQGINNIDDVVILYPTANIIISDSELPRTNDLLISLA